MRRGMATVVAAGLLPATVSAGQPSGEVAMGHITTDGNAQSRSINGKLAFDYREDRWKNSFLTTTLNSAGPDGTTAERYQVGEKLDYTFNDRHYTFAALDFEKDHFGGVERRMSETVGYGYHFLTGPRHILDAEVGGGSRQTRENITGIEDTDAIARASGKYKWAFNDKDAFVETIKVESGEDNTISESLTELRFGLVGNLYTILSYSVRNNSNVPPGMENVDTSTSVTLSYAFGTQR